MPTYSYQPGGLVAGPYPLAHRTVTIASGQELERGAVLGRVTADDKYVLSATAAVDGSADPVAVLPDAVDATGGDVTVQAFFSGEFAADKLVYGTGHDADTVEAACRVTGLPIFVRKRV
ncbi:head decoration protein [Stappia sp. F7233]|uniref:Head decoration protein n=1 Tax=Stappia albiluteola TaxID=2758565 RepID=A0A839AKX6_9HYPH|nr:head decoration protein [Stappia albiluteola]MBA5779522.1 head decoration protein [Stappia albiluteola]